MHPDSVQRCQHRFAAQWTTASSLAVPNCALVAQSTTKRHAISHGDPDVGRKCVYLPAGEPDVRHPPSPHRRQGTAHGDHGRTRLASTTAAGV